MESAQKLVERRAHRAVCATADVKVECSSSVAQSGHLLWPVTTHATQDPTAWPPGLCVLSKQLRSVGIQLTTLLVLPEKCSAGLWEE